MRRRALLGGLAALLVAAGLLIIERLHLVQRERSLREVVLHADSMEVEKDSTRILALPSIPGDSVRLAQRRIYQLEQQRSTLERSLGLERRARYEMAVTVASLRANVDQPLLPDSAVRGAHHSRIAITQAPYHAVADIEVNYPPDTTVHLDLSVTLDTLALTAYVHCDEHHLPVPAASLIVQGPRWAAITLKQLEQAPEVCQRAVSLQPRTFSLRIRPMLAVGRMLNAPGGWGLTAGVGITF